MDKQLRELSKLLRELRKMAREDDKERPERDKEVDAKLKALIKTQKRTEKKLNRWIAERRAGRTDLLSLS